MKAKVLMATALVISSLTISNSLWAHHASWQMYEDKSITLTGFVTDYEWTNPHSILSVAVKDDKAPSKPGMLKSFLQVRCSEPDGPSKVLSSEIRLR